MWPALVDMSKDDCRKALRAMELETYGGMVDVLRAQGHFSSDKKKLLTDVASALSIPLERHKAEIRRAVNDDTLNSIAEMLVGPNTSTEWAIEGRRHIPLLPRPPQHSILTALADETADYISTEHDTHFSTYESAQRAAEVPFSVEPASPEPSKTQVRAASPSGLIVLPSGAAIQMKREPEEEEIDRKKRKMPHNEESSLTVSPSSSPPAKMASQVQQIPMTSRTMPFPPGSTPLKIALPTSGNRTPTSSIQPFATTPKQVIIVSSSASPNTPSILQKTLSVPMKATNVKPTVMYTANPSTNAGDGFKPRVKPLTTTTVAKSRPNAIVMSQKPQLKAGITPVKHTVPLHAKIVVQQKPMQRTVQKPQHVVVQQKTGKQTVVTNVQLKTPQGFTNVPVQLRTGPKPSMQLKQDAGGQIKMLSVSGGAKILPKPQQQPVYVVTASTTPLTMVTRTVPASCPPRVMTVTTGSQGMKWSPSTLSNKSLQTVHVMTQPRRHDSVVLLQKSSASKGLVTHSSKELPVNKGPTKTAQKPATTLSSGFSSIHQLPQTAGGANVFLVDLGNQEKMPNNPMLADILQASGILEGDSKSVTIDVGPPSEEVEDLEAKDDKDDVKEGSVPVTALSIEEAVEMLNRSDTPETRALLSQAGIQISDEIADSEEEEQLLDSSPMSEPIIVSKKEEPPAMKVDHADVSATSVHTPCADIIVSKELTTPSTSIASTVHSISSRPRQLDIFTKALASANINLDSFMEDEDDADASAEEKDEGKPTLVKEESADSSTDPLDLQLAALTGDIGH